MALRDYSNIVVSFEAQTVTREGFGTVLFLTEDDTESPGTVTTRFGSLKEVEDAGYATDSEPYKAASSAFAAGKDYGFQKFKIAHKDSASSMPDDWITAIGDAEEADSDWYALAIESRDPEVVEKVADNIEARPKMFIGVTDSADVKDGQTDTDVVSKVLAKDLSRTAVFYRSGGDYAETAWFGRMLPLDPGTANWAWKTLSGIATDSFTSGEISALRNKRCNYYDSVAGNSITYAGTTAEPGMYLDIVRGIDWIQQRMQEDYVSYQGSVDRIPYIGGGEIVESQVIRRRLDVAVDRGVIKDDYDVTVPPWFEQDPTDRAERHYPGITFKATYVGAINSVEVRGTVKP